MAMRVSNTQLALLCSAWTGLYDSESLPHHETARRMKGRGPHPEWERQASFQREGFTRVSEVPQRHGGESLGHRTPQGSSSLGSYNHKALSYQWPTYAG